MAPYQSQFRELYHGLLDVEGADVAPLLASWADSNRAILEPYRKFRQLNATGNSYEVGHDELHSLYALSRVCDVMLLARQAGDVWFDLTRAEFADFWQTLGILASEPCDYHPFWCEIVACENGADDDAPPRIEEVFWPALTWGELLICRAGVRVCAGRNWMNADVASSSPLYFALRRGYRAAHDLSHGWGGNSQWGTAFRRDYVWNEHFVFNADGALTHKSSPFLRSLSAHEWAELLKVPRSFFVSDKGDNAGLTLAAREELLVNRCLIGDAINDTGDYWPYDDVAVWRCSAPLAPAC